MMAMFFWLSSSCSVLLGHWKSCIASDFRVKLLNGRGTMIQRNIWRYHSDIIVTWYNIYLYNIYIYIYIANQTDIFSSFSSEAGRFAFHSNGDLFLRLKRCDMLWLHVTRDSGRRVNLVTWSKWKNNSLWLEDDNDDKDDMRYLKKCNAQKKNEFSCS